MTVTRSTIAARSAARHRLREALRTRSTASVVAPSNQAGPTETSCTQKPLAPDTRGPEDTFPFLRLPGEIRNLVYDFALAEHEKYHFLDTVQPPPLASVSRQMRKESLSSFLKSNTFHIILWKNSKDLTTDIQPSTLNWLKDIGLHIPLIKHLHISFDQTHDMRNSAFLIDMDSKPRFKHASICFFCLENGSITNAHDTSPDLPPSIATHLDILEQKMRKAHDESLVALSRSIFPSLSHKNTQALSIADIEVIAAILNLQDCEIRDSIGDDLDLQIVQNRLLSGMRYVVGFFRLLESEDMLEVWVECYHQLIY